MSLVALVIALVIVLAIGKLLVRFLGWPTNRAALMRWGMTLLAASVLLSGLPDLWRCIRPTLRVPTVSLLDLVPLLTVVGLAFVGYVGWVRGGAERERLERLDERTRFMGRLPARPPAPPAERIFETVDPSPREPRDG